SSLFLDFSKAFDKVPHKRLLIKLKSYGVKDPLHSWFASFLKGRKQTVKFNNSLSSPKPITSGVIQGSVLGPLLFVIYINDITTQRDKGLLVSSLFLDFSKAFDKVPHKRLLIKLKSYGVKDPLHSWFASFLKGRKQTVKFNNSLSSPKPITSGVIQGSVLGPLLFVIYINDITTQRDKGLLVSSLFLDFSKAFDKVPHKRLLIKLKSYGVKDPLHSWFASFLKGRKQTVKFNNSLSSPKPITSGVIQGSVLGPLLFVIYINDITTQRDKGLLVSSLFLDFSKAFDKVPHKRLLIKLKSYGVKDPLHSWFASFLKGRKQTVKFNNSLSSPKPITNNYTTGQRASSVQFISRLQ
ncbi:hypothetical protein MN116_000052, partial [Schistosoma mekongi]